MVRVVRDVFGTMVNPFTKQTQEIYRYTMTNDKGMSAAVITYGATITSLMVPDKYNQSEDIVLGFDDVKSYSGGLDTNPYLGCTVGRVCSRVGNGQFKLNGEVIEVSRNMNKKHQLHGGVLGFSKVIWDIACERPDGVTMQFCSPDGHEGYPGVVTAHVTFTLTEDNCFDLLFEATTTKSTPINMCNHAYFNLAGHAAGCEGMYDHEVIIKASKMHHKDEETVPTGLYVNVISTAYDLRSWKNVGMGIKEMAPAPGYDDSYCLELDDNRMTTVAQAYHPPSGRLMKIITDQLAMHFYTAHNMPDVPRGAKPMIIGKGGAKYSKHGSFCMETSAYPDAVNHENFPSIILNPGQKYSHRCVFRFEIKK